MEIVYTLCAQEVVKGYGDIVYINGSNVQWTDIENDFTKELASLSAWSFVG